MRIELNEGDVLEVVVHLKSTLKEIMIDPRTDQCKIFYKEDGSGFKDGDVLILVRGDQRECPFIYKGLNKDKSYQFYVGIDSMNGAVISRDNDDGWGCSEVDYATEAEKLDFFNKLKSEGLRWNPETKEVEKVSDEFKDGDILKSIYSDKLVIFKGFNGSSELTFKTYYNTGEITNDGWVTDAFRPATGDEIQCLTDYLKVNGLHWDSEARELKKIKGVVKSDKFKNGDILHSKHYHEFAIFKEYIDDERWPLFRSYYNTDGRSNDDLSVGYFRLATDDEVRELYRELGSKGLSWNPIKNELMRIRRRVPTGHIYLYITSSGMVVETIEGHTSIDDLNFKIGNYFLPEDRAKAEKAAEEITTIYGRQLKP